MLTDPTGQPYVIPPKEGEIYLSRKLDHSKTYIIHNSKPVDVSNRHMRREWIKRISK